MKDLTKGQLVLFILAAACLLVSALFGFCLIGYLTTALLFLAGAACLAFFGLLAPKKTPGARRARAALAALILVGLCLFLAAEVPVLQDCRSDADTSAPWLIVCGAGVNGTVPSRSLTDRLHEAETWLADNPGGRAVLSGGQGDGEDVTEAQAMFDWLTARGMDASRLLLEKRAGSSQQNIQYSLALIADRDGRLPARVAILSAEYHLHRLGYMAEKLGCPAVLVAARTTNPLLFMNYAAREAFAMWKLWLFGLD